MTFNIRNVKFAWIRFDVGSNDHELKQLQKYWALILIDQDSFVGVTKRNAPKFGTKF